MCDDFDGENTSSDAFLACQIVEYSDDDHSASMPIFKASRDEDMSEPSDAEDDEAPARTAFPADAGDTHCYSVCVLGVDLLVTDMKVGDWKVLSNKNVLIQVSVNERRLPLAGTREAASARCDGST